MESAGERYFRTSCWRTSRNRQSEISDTKTAISEIPYKAFSMWYCVHHWFCKPFISILFEMLKSQKKQKKKWQLHTAKLTWQRKRRIFIGGTFGKNYNEGKDIKVTQELQEFQIHKQLTEEKINVSNTGKWGGGGTPKNSWWGCAARFSKYWPYYRPKHVIFQTRLQTCTLNPKDLF